MRAAYPGALFWPQDGGGWMLTTCRLLDGSPRPALIATAVSDRHRSVRAWGFWDQGIIAPPVWIGPRHTNFNDGSICAFDRRDESAWRFGEPLIRLLDYYTLWSLRQLHLQTFGRWPGMQSAGIPYERILELSSEEFCGCSNSRTKYRDCCEARDKRRDPIVLAIQYFALTNGGERHPPAAVVAFAQRRGDPPPISTIFE